MKEQNLIGPILLSIKLRLGFWLEGWSPSCPFNPSEIAYKLDYVRLWKEKKEVRRNIAWSPPPPNKVKWNVDGSSRGKPGPTSIGGILRDDHGVIRALFAASVRN